MAEKEELFGQRAMRLGFASELEIKTALETQKILMRRSKMLGDIFLELNFIDQDKYLKVVDAIDEERKGKDIMAEEACELFCEKAVAFGYVNEDQVKKAKKVRKELEVRGKLIGQVMIELGALTNQQLQEILTTYSKES